MKRRLPIYLLLDTSGSMNGEPIAAVQNGVQMVMSALQNDPQALETAYISIITFESEVKQLIPLTELSQFNPPQLRAGGCTSMGEALKFISESADKEIMKNTPDTKGDWKPMVFIVKGEQVIGMTRIIVWFSSGTKTEQNWLSAEKVIIGYTP